MKIDNGYSIIENVKDFYGWELLWWEERKPGVFRVIIKKNLKEIKISKIVFCKLEYMPIDIDAHNSYWKASTVTSLKENL